MAYQKHTWKERLGTGLNKFKDTITGAVMALVNQPDSVTQAGTPVRADWLNEMEEGIYQAHVTADAALPKSGGTMTGHIDMGGKTLVLKTNKYALLVDSAGDPIIYDYSGPKAYKLNKDFAEQTTLDEHVVDKNNPHGVNKEDVGLSDVLNMPTATISEIVAGTASRYVSAAALKGALTDLTVGNASKIGGFSQSFENAIATIVRRSGADASIRVGRIMESGVYIDQKYLMRSGGKMTGTLDMGGKTLLLDTNKFGLLISSNGLDVLLWDYSASKGYKLNNNYTKIRYGSSVPSTLQPGELFVQI